MSPQRRGRDVLLEVDADPQQFVVLLDSRPFKRVPLKGLPGTLLTVNPYLDPIGAEAVSEHRRWLRAQRSQTTHP